MLNCKGSAEIQVCKSGVTFNIQHMFIDTMLPQPWSNWGSLGKRRGEKPQYKKMDKSGKSVGVRNGGNMIGEEDGRESGMAARQS